MHKLIHLLIRRIVLLNITFEQKEPNSRKQKCLCKFLFDVYFAPFNFVHFFHQRHRHILFIGCCFFSSTWNITDCHRHYMWIQFMNNILMLIYSWRKKTAKTFFPFKLKYATQFSRANVSISLKTCVYSHLSICYGESQKRLRNWNLIFATRIEF